jgi:peptidoglycan/xylan/chitin deacetylase (PgdA/CDA1 family)
LKRSLIDAASTGSAPVVLHSVTGPPGSELARRLERTTAHFGELRPLVGPFSRPIVRLSGPDDLLLQASESLPTGAALAEAAAVRLRRAGVPLSWGAPDLLTDSASFIRLCQARGASSVEFVRTDPTLLTELQLGAFFHAYWRRRAFRRAACALGRPGAVTRAPRPLLSLAADTAFWLGVRSIATDAEWDRFTRSSYVVFYYHRIGHEGQPGQERLDVHPRRFERQVRILRLLGFRPLSPDELLTFHTDAQATLPPRSFVVGADDGFRDAVAALRGHARLRPQVFVNTSWVGETAWWGYDEPLAAWDELEEFQAAGGVIGSHCRDHPRLPELDDEMLREELTGSLRELRARLPEVAPLLAYPHGGHDERVRSAAAAAGYRAAFTTEPGRNGAGTDVYCLRRLGIKDWDGAAALIWKATTGELLPWLWERWRRRRVGARAARRAARQAREGGKPA